MPQGKIEADYKAEGKCSHGVPKGDHCEDCQRANKSGSVNISAAKEVLERARAGTAEPEEINEMVKTLRDLQNGGINAPEISATLTGLVAARGE